MGRSTPPVQVLFRMGAMSIVKGKVISCKGLKNVDLWGKSDPFVQVTLKKGKDVLGEMKTSTKTDELDPVWEGEVFNFTHDDALNATLEFKVMDTGLGPDTELGEAIVAVKLIPFVEEHVTFTMSLGIHSKKSLGTIVFEAGVTPEPGLFG